MPGGGLVTALSGSNALANDMMSNKIKGAEADYAPYTQYANAASKIAYANLTPYQIQAQVMSNPMVWAGIQQLQKTNPNAAANMMRNLVQSIPNPSQMMTGAGMPPVPQQQSHGLMNALKNLLGGSGSSNPPSGNALNVSPSGMDSGQGAPSPDQAGSPMQGNEPMESPDVNPNIAGTGLVPGAQGMGAGVLGQKTMPFSESPNTPGKPFVNAQGDVVSAPGAHLTEQVQRGMQAIKDVQQDLKSISEGASRWLAPGMKGKLKAIEGINLIRQNVGDVGGIIPQIMKQTGLTTKDLSEYNEWNAKQEKVQERLLNAFGWPQNQDSQAAIRNIIEPTPGEGEEYGKRINNELEGLVNSTLPSYQQTAGGGLMLKPAEKPAESVPAYKDKSVKNAIKQEANKFKSEMIKLSGPDPKDGNKIKTWVVPQGAAQQYIDNGFKRIG